MRDVPEMKLRPGMVDHRILDDDDEEEEEEDDDDDCVVVICKEANFGTTTSTSS